MSSILDNLNKQQKKAALQVHGPQIIFAGAGSGKTRTLTHKIAYMCSIGIDPSSILAITFTNKAANEMRERIEKLVGDKGKLITSKTFHSFCVQIIRRNPEIVDLNKDFKILNDKDQVNIIKEIIDNPEYELFEEKEVIEYISDKKNKGIDSKVALLEATTVDDADLATMYNIYQSTLKELNSLDFDDLLIFALSIVRKKSPREYWSDKYQFMFVDEFQDTNAVQFELVKELTKKYNNLCVVGDDYQAIYGWRGSNIDYIINFKDYYPDAKEYTLETNYRSTPNIVESAKEIINLNSYKVDKVIGTNKIGKNSRIYISECYNEYHEASYICDEIKKNKYKYNDVAILYRSNNQSEAVAEVFKNHNIPFTILKDVDPLSTAPKTDTNKVKLLTAHGSKGLEFPIVFIIGAAEELFPLPAISYKEMEEERRLFYVAMTRAEDKLYITYPKSRTVFNKKKSYSKSHLVEHLPKNRIKNHRRISW
tara:strand:+ start:105 stop:1547 length:1443 start_codon:yes stop_codon:yes gene_type:complete